MKEWPSCVPTFKVMTCGAPDAAFDPGALWPAAFRSLHHILGLAGGPVACLQVRALPENSDSPV